MKTASRLAMATALAALVAALAPAPARAEFTTTNIQVLQGWDFHDTKYGYDTVSGAMTTVTLNHFSTWKYGDNFAFVDFMRGNYQPGGEFDSKSQVYGEWHPRLFVNKLLGQEGDALGFIRNWGLAAELNQSGAGFYAYLFGVGFDFATPFPLGMNVYYRYDRFDGDQWQLSPFWTVPFKVGKVPFVFTGFIDICGTKEFGTGNSGVDVTAQPELLVDALAPFGGAENKLLVGVEWALHSYPGHDLVSAPQAMIQWNIF